jgi:UDP-glucose 4-epimerase
MTMRYKDKKQVFITGACGFVGRHLVARLLDEGASLYIVDNLSTGKHPDKWLDAEWKKEGSDDRAVYRKGDQTITYRTQDALKFFTDAIDKREELPDFSDVFHLSSIVGGRALIDGDPLLVSFDLAIDAVFFVWATRFPQKFERIMYTSSSAAYPIHLQGKDGALALEEGHVRFDHGMGVPDMTYGWSKLSGEFLARLAHQKYGLHVACVRPFSGYGEDQDLTYPVPSIALRVARRDSPIEVWGTGEQGRDFVHIDDCVDAMLAILDKVNDGSGINIGSGILTSFNQLIALLCELENHSAEIKRLTDKPVGVQSRYADPTVLNGTIGWKPTISLKDGMSRVLAHAHKRLNNENVL